jgi:K+-transporting ATPase ATPase B chain
VMVTGDNPLTAKSIAEKAGVDDYIAQATPEAKLSYIRKEQQGGKLVAMMGDGTNDAPALAQADIGVAMNSGTQAAKEAGNMVDLDSDPTKLIEVVEIGKQLLMTRGALTTFSIANDLAKYFAVIPAMFIVTLPELRVLDIMGLATRGGAYSAILAAVIFNALIIPLLIPIALKGVKYRPVGAGALLRRNLLYYTESGNFVRSSSVGHIDWARWIRPRDHTRSLIDVCPGPSLPRRTPTVDQSPCEETDLAPLPSRRPRQAGTLRPGHRPHPQL